LTSLKNESGLPPKIKASFEESYLQVEQNLLWYKCYHTTINQWTGAPAEPTMTESDTTVSLSDTTVSSSNTTVSLSDTTVTLSDTTVLSSNTTETLSNTTVSSNYTTVPWFTQQPMYPTFDFDNSTPGPSIISKCPERSGQSSCQSNLSLIIIAVTMATTMLLILKKKKKKKKKMASTYITEFFLCTLIINLNILICVTYRHVVVINCNLIIIEYVLLLKDYVFDSNML